MTLRDRTGQPRRKTEKKGAEFYSSSAFVVAITQQTLRCQTGSRRSAIDVKGGHSFFVRRQIHATLTSYCRWDSMHATCTGLVVVVVVVVLMLITTSCCLASGQFCLYPSAVVVTDFSV